jgi:hypothetical protein
VLDKTYNIIRLFDNVTNANLQLTKYYGGNKRRVKYHLGKIRHAAIARQSIPASRAQGSEQPVS